MLHVGDLHFYIAPPGGQTLMPGVLLFIKVCTAGAQYLGPIAPPGGQTILPGVLQFI